MLRPAFYVTSKNLCLPSGTAYNVSHYQLRMGTSDWEILHSFPSDFDKAANIPGFLIIGSRVLPANLFLSFRFFFTYISFIYCDFL